MIGYVAVEAYGSCGSGRRHHSSIRTILVYAVEKRFAGLLDELSVYKSDSDGFFRPQLICHKKVIQEITETLHFCTLQTLAHAHGKIST